MKIVVQRVSSANVVVANTEIAHIKQGFLLFVGIEQGDNLQIAQKFADKITKLRIFSDEDDKMNLTLTDVSGEILSVSQFTLLANTKKGNRPSFTDAMDPKFSEPLFDLFNERIKENGISVKTGQFGADMAVSLVNDGPVSIIFQEKIG